MRWPHDPEAPYLWHYLGATCAIAASLYWLSPHSEHWVLALPVAVLMGLLGFGAGYAFAFSWIFLFGHKYPRVISVARAVLAYGFVVATALAIMERSFVAFRDVPVQLLPYVGTVAAWAGWSVGLVKVGKVA